MIKILFLIHDLGHGGAENVLVNLVNNMDRSLFDISVTALFGGGVNEQFLKPDIHYNAVFSRMIPGNSKLMKILTPKQLHKICVKEHYDIEVSYLEGPSARVISGCQDDLTKLVSWIHTDLNTTEKLAQSFRSVNEARKCYNRFNSIICVSDFVKQDFCSVVNYNKDIRVLYNTVETDKIINMAKEEVDCFSPDNSIRLVAIGTIKKIKGYDRLVRIIKRLREDGFNVCLYILGKGPDQEKLERLISDNNLKKYITLLGYQTNPYKYLSRCDLFVCSSHVEGFSTAATEALVVGVPVCTVEVSGMKEMLGEKNEYGIITDNDEIALYEGIKRMLADSNLLAYYKEQAIKRGKKFSTKNTVKAVEKMFQEL